MKYASITAVILMTFPRSLLASMEYSGSVNLGAHYDSNLTVSELDQATNSGDKAVTTGAKLALKKTITPALQISTKFGGQFTQYAQLDSFDLRVLSGNVTAAYKNHYGKWSAMSYLADAHLGGNAFLTYQQHGIAWGKSFWQNAYLRVSTDGINKQFASQPGRNANAVKLTVNGFWFTENTAEMLSLSYSFQSEQAKNTAFNFASHSISSKGVFPFQLWTKAWRLSVAYQFEYRGFSGQGVSTTPSPISTEPARRNDHRHRVTLGFNGAINESFNTEVQLKYADFRSSEDSAEYSESQIHLGITYIFNG